MKKHQLILTLLIAVFPFAAHSETGLGFNNGGNYFSPYAPQPLGVQVFDDSVFKLKRKSRPVYSKEGRFLESRPDFSEAQRNAWIQECKSTGKHSFKKFQTCFDQKKARYEKEQGEMMRRDADVERQEEEKPRTSTSSGRLDPYP
jgi:hypothetical protein